MTATTISTERGPVIHIGAGTVVPLTEAVRRLRGLPSVEREVLALRLGLT
jgi:hypothetical protein